MKPHLFATLAYLVSLSASTHSIKADIRKYALKSDANPISENYAINGSQERSMWCWAACAQMALATQGVVASQASIAASVKGLPIDAPANVPELLGTLTRISYDGVNGLVTSIAAAFTKDANGQLTYNGATFNPPSQALLLGYGVPSIALLKGDGNIGHFVLVTGVSFDREKPRLATSYEIRDPWPLDKHGKRIPGFTAMRSTMSGDEFRSRCLSVIIPFTICSQNEKRFEKLLTILLDPDKLKQFSIDDLDKFAGVNGTKTYALTDDDAALKDWETVDTENDNDFLIQNQTGYPSIDWGDKLSGDCTVRYRIKNLSRTARYKLQLTTLINAKRRDSENVVREIDRKETTIFLEPGEQKHVRFDLRYITADWQPSPTEFPSAETPRQNKNLIVAWKQKVSSKPENDSEQP